MTDPSHAPAEPVFSPVEPPRDPALAFEAMVRVHYGGLCAFAYRQLGSRELAEDVVHDVLLRMWRDRDRFEFREPLAYLYRAVRNRIVSEHRRTGTRARLLEEGAAGGYLPTSVPDAAGTVEDEELARAAAEAVAALPERCRLVYTLRRDQGLSYAEIAQILDITVKTVENQITRAGKLLRARLASYLPVGLAVSSAALDVLRRIGN